MQERLNTIPHDSHVTALTYQHGTHFLFPESMLRIILPVGGKLLIGFAFRAGRMFPKQCRLSRTDLDRKLQKIIEEWEEEDSK